METLILLVMAALLGVGAAARWLAALAVAALSLLLGVLWLARDDAGVWLWIVVALAAGATAGAVERARRSAGRSAGN